MAALLNRRSEIGRVLELRPAAASGQGAARFSAAAQKRTSPIQNYSKPNADDARPRSRFSLEAFKSTPVIRIEPPIEFGNCG